MTLDSICNSCGGFIGHLRGGKPIKAQRTLSTKRFWWPLNNRGWMHTEYRKSQRLTRGFGLKYRNYNTQYRLPCSHVYNPPIQPPSYLKVTHQAGRKKHNKADALKGELLSDRARADTSALGSSSCLTWNFPVIPWATTVSTKTTLWSKFCNSVQH